jgi:hypothetical protein
VSRKEPKKWGPSIVGFGSCNYKYSSGHEESPLPAFPPGKSAISLFVFSGLVEHCHLFDNLGKFTLGKVFVYVKKLNDIDLNELEKLMIEKVKWLEKNVWEKLRKKRSLFLFNFAQFLQHEYHRTEKSGFRENFDYYG